MEPYGGAGAAGPRARATTSMAKEGYKPGDWTCPGCNDHQFAKNETCRKCGTPKPMISSNNQVMKTGDWICPNPDCGDIQFAKNETCRKCSTPRPDDDGGARDRSRSPQI